ncbi:hypothetical protein PINS_up021378 [Pythium insidiosum]|nr:hypothetical protein PINS_up021378 [Pythium insidiosum]
MIRMGGLISKRKGLFSKKRQLILTSRPRLIYIDPIRMRQKGEIPWSPNLYVTTKSATAFDVVTPNRVYHLNDVVNGSKKWIDAINTALLASDPDARLAVSVMTAGKLEWSKPR